MEARKTYRNSQALLPGGGEAFVWSGKRMRKSYKSLIGYMWTQCNSRRLAVIMSLLICTISSNAQVVEWVRWYQRGESDGGYSVVQADDGGFYVVGRSIEYLPQAVHNRAMIVRTDFRGDTLWTRLFGDSLNIFMNSAVLYQNELWTAGSIDSGTLQSTYPVLFRFQLDGEPIDTIFLDRSLFGYSVSRLTLNHQSGFLIRSSQVSLTAVDMAGNALWSFNGPENPYIESGFAVLPSGGYVIACSDTSYFPNLRCWIRIYWLNEIGQAVDSVVNDSRLSMAPWCVLPISDDIVFIGGFTQTGSNFFQQSDLVFRADRHMGIIWQYVGREPYGATSLQFVGGEIWSVVGSRFSEMGPKSVNVKYFDPDGYARDSLTVPVEQSGSSYNTVYAAAFVAPQSIVITGATDYPGPEISYRAFLTKVSNPNSLPDYPPQNHQTKGRLQAYMGDGFCRLSLDVPLVYPLSEISVYDILGRLVAHETRSSMNATVVSIPMPFASGPYFIRLTNGPRMWTAKVFLSQ